jgi:NADH-quinone oxidoreductase subunit N
MSPLFTQLLIDLSWIQPELLLAAFALIGALIGAWFGDRATSALTWVGAAVMIVAGVLAIQLRPGAVGEGLGPISIFNGSLQVDDFAAYAKALIAFSAAACLLLASEFFNRSQEHRFELPLLATLAVLGMFIMASANDLIALYMGVELQSLAAYVLAAFRRDDARSSEAGLKYFVLGALSSGLLLYGASLVYGFSGSVRFDEIANAAAAGGGGAGLIFGLVFMICGLAFKLSAAPFHMWAPDVYEGAPTPIAAFFSAAPKVAAVALTARLLNDPFAALQWEWRQVVAVIAGISMLVGVFGALAQTNIKRLMAYSSIANMGFVLMALAAGGANGSSAAMMYMAMYVPATIGVFAVIQAMKRDGEPAELITDLAGLAKNRPWMGAFLTMMVFSLAGIPPLAGFFGKYFAIQATLQAGLLPLALVAAVATVVGAGYYLWILAKVWFDAPAPRFDGTGAVAAAATGLGAVLTFPLLLLALNMMQTLFVAAAQASFTTPGVP